MAEKTTAEKNQFEAEVYKLGLEMIEDYRQGNCPDRNEMLKAIIELFKVSQNAGLILSGGKSNE